MNDITQQGRKAVSDIAGRNKVSEQSVMDMLHALQSGHGKAAQFNIRELGGMGQWSSGGMTQVGDMFNDRLKQTVNDICTELAKLLQDRAAFSEANEGQNYNPDGSTPPRQGSWWPSDLGSPASTGSQNDMQYAMFPDAHRLAVRQGGTVTVYDSGEHRIGGFAQSQSGNDQNLQFTSQTGTISTKDLTKIG